VVSNIRTKMTFPYRLAAQMYFLTLVVGQSKPHPLPRDFSEKLLRTRDGESVWFTSNQMKKRATRRVDISPLLRQADIKGTAIVDIVVNPSGAAVCVKSLVGHPMIRLEVEKAVKNWTFTPANMEGKPIAYAGEMEFSLCNSSCGDEGPSMTLLK
jgi:hypothetical protein